MAALGLASVALLGVFPASLPAAAEPPTTVAQARNLIKQLQNDAAGIDQQYTDVQEQIKEGRAQLRLKQADAQAQTKEVERLKLQAELASYSRLRPRLACASLAPAQTPSADSISAEDLRPAIGGQQRCDFSCCPSTPWLACVAHTG
jgi:hypothetical protein